MSQSQEAKNPGIDSQSLSTEQILLLREFVRNLRGIENAKQAAEELAKSQKAA